MKKHKNDSQAPKFLCQTFTERLPVVMAGAVVRGSQLSLGFRAQILFLTSSPLQVLF